MPAPLGTWNINANGNTGQLILSAGTGGGVTGTAFTDPITAVWDETSQILSFSRATKDGGATGNTFAFEVYTGTLFQPYRTSHGAITGEGVPFMLAGNFGTFALPAGPFGPTDQSGWFALNTVKFKEKEGKEGTKDVKDGKDGKDHKDKEQKDHKEKEPADLQQFSQQSLPQADMAAAMTEAGTAREVRIATGKSFIPAEERPLVGQAALQTANETN
jgi:hypothetical protein